MPRIRSIKPEFWRSPSTAKASPRARLLYIAMWNWADDYGVGEWTVRELLGFAFPNDEDLTSAEFQSLCTEVAACFGTVFYTVGGRRFYCIPAWDEHQKNERRAQGKYPRPDDPNAAPDQAFMWDAERRGSSVLTVGYTAPGTGEQGNREQGTGNRGTGELASSVEALFDDAYSHWPKKVERKAALEKFKALNRKAGGADTLASLIVRFGDAYAATTEKKYTPALSVWLGHERWTDELPTPSNPVLSNRTQTALATVAYYADQESDRRGIAS